MFYKPPLPTGLSNNHTGLSVCFSQPSAHCANFAAPVSPKLCSVCRPDEALLFSDWHVDLCIYYFPLSLFLSSSSSPSISSSFFHCEESSKRFKACVSFNFFRFFFPVLAQSVDAIYWLHYCWQIARLNLLLLLLPHYCCYYWLWNYSY